MNKIQLQLWSVLTVVKKKNYEKKIQFFICFISLLQTV